VTFGSGGCSSNEAVGVALLRSSIDIAEPGRGLGLGLGGASLALALSLSSSPASVKANTIPSTLLELPLCPMLALAPSPRMAWAKSRGSGEYGANRSDFGFAEASALCGVRPAARTFLRALNPMQSTSCRMASRSETARRGAVRVRRSVLAHERDPIRRIGVASSVVVAAGVRSGVGYASTDGCIALVAGVSENASAVGPHEKPMKKDSASSRRMEWEVVRSTESPGEVPSSDG
jgi:hypothetical protein